MPSFRLAGIALFVLQPWQAAQSAPEEGDVPPIESVVQSESPTYYTYKIVHAWPHDPDAFTQGLLFHNGMLLESTGLFGKSSLREVTLETGRVAKNIPIPSPYFAEGLAVIGSRIYQLTWQNHKGFVYDVDSLAPEGQFTYRGEGWGLTSDGRFLILSDGTDRIRFLEPDSYHVVRDIRVSLAGHTLPMLNELEWIGGEIFANVWQTDEVVRIDPKSGNVNGVVDLYGLLPAGDRRVDTDVLNGIAYDSDRNRLFITGKRWPKIFEVRLVRK
jgi:glutamine cyclotransferase